jgi:hypothetical protein
MKETNMTKTAPKKNVLTAKGVRDRIVVNANVADGRQFKPTSMAVAMVNAALLYDCRGSNA